MYERTKPDRGASTVEYVTLLFVVAAIVAAATLAIPNPVGDNAKVALCKLFNAITGRDAQCSAPPFQYRPSKAACVTGQDSQKVGASVTVFSVKFGQNFQLLRINTADGRVKVMVVPADYKLGVEGEEGAKFNFGKDSGLHGGGKVEGAVGLKYGDTWSFPDQKAADHFLDDMKFDWGRREAEKVSPLLWGFDKITGWEPKTPDPDSQQLDVNAELLGNYGVKFGDLETGEDGEKSVTDIGTGVEVEGKVGDGVSVIKDRDNPANPSDPSYPRTSVVFNVQGSIKGGAKVLGFGGDRSVNYIGQTKATYDKNGKLVGITWVTTHEQSGSGGFKSPGGNNATEKNADKKVTTTTTTVTFDDSNRALGEKWLHDNAFLVPLQTVRNAFDENGSFSTKDPGPNGSAFDKLIYNQGVVSRNTYAGNVDEYGIGVEAGDELTFGADLSYEHEKTQLVDSQYLDAPRNGERHFVQWPDCRNAG